MFYQCVKKAKLLLAIMVVAAAFSSFSLSLIPLASKFGKVESSMIAYMIAAVFWGGWLLMLVAAYMTKRILYNCHEKLKRQGYIRRRQRPGIFHFSFNRKNVVLYTVTALGLLLIITDIIFSYIPEAIMFPIISVTILSFAVHCVVDGKYYKAYKLIKESVNNETNR